MVVRTRYPTHVSRCKTRNTESADVGAGKTMLTPPEDMPRSAHPEEDLRTELAVLQAKMRMVRDSLMLAIKTLGEVG
jgi:hypothetical protein